MAISTRDQLINAMGNNSSRIIIDKASLANQVAGRYSSMWRATGQPGQGAIPTSAAIPTSGTLGAMGFANQTDPTTSYLSYLFAVSSNSAMTLEIHDRIAHMGGLVLNVTTEQSPDINLDTLAPDAARVGAANYSDLQWWLEVYADGGATGSNATINVTYDDDSTGNLNVQAVGGTIRAGHMFALTPLIPTAKQGLYIKAINTVTLSASTGTAGNFGFTATRPRTMLPLYIANKGESADWAQLGLPQIANYSCLFSVILSSTTSTGTLRGGGKISHG